jgi:DNA (cytosine-5)-methyltransferase 1
MKYGTVCSGIEAPTIGWEPLGWKPQWFSEIAKFPSAVLAHQYPHVPNLGDMTKLLDNDPAPIDLLCGGTPCQDFSIAGLRAGLDGDRGNLALEFCRIADRMRPRWVVWENVPGVLSSNEGRDFGAIVGALVEIGYGVAWRVLDAQYFGLAQKRKRVFLVGCDRGWQYSAAVLFEREGLRWSAPPSRKKGKGFTYSVAPSLRAKGPGTRRVGDQTGQDPLVAVPEISKALLAGGGFRMDDQETLLPDVAPTLCAEGKGAGSLTGQMANAGGLVYNSQQITSPHNRSNPKLGDPAPTLTAQDMGPYYVFNGVRRLMPIECERLQGFPDGFTQVPYRGKDAKDGPRYEAIGNSMATPVLNWLGTRIDFVDSLLNEAL